MRRFAVLVPLALLAACGPSEEEKAERASKVAADIAEVEAAQNAKPPLQPLRLEPITRQDVEANNFYGAGCTFGSRDGTNPTVIAQSGRAVIKVTAELQVLYADIGGSKLEMGAWEHYTGKNNTLTIRRTDKDAKPSATSGEAEYTAELTVFDGWGREVVRQAGPIHCKDN
ncbi:hypothetical protein B0I00_0607 [Novosphingobium kunmingense]|uniref:Lipoprotein n=1 Tax=Novosphingobium kunmingense TaxID=1211806 RepID=A0A2N0I2H6_9SPHN|nr:hypothetical protein [Novosphingobium kunmingense]PKB25408.1 hypothetical protein B0I00_0607 [Novosphingobium kunmingense]